MIGKYVHPDNNPIHKAAEKNDRDHSSGVQKNIHADQISGWDNMEIKKSAKAKIGVASHDRK